MFQCCKLVQKMSNCIRKYISLIMTWSCKNVCIKTEESSSSQGVKKKKKRADQDCNILLCTANCELKLQVTHCRNWEFSQRFR